MARKVLLFPYIVVFLAPCLLFMTLLMTSIICLYPIVGIFEVWEKGKWITWGNYLRELGEIAGIK